MGLKILHSADWHLDSPFTGFTPEQRVYLKSEQLKIPQKMADLCRRKNCDLVLLSGDLFDGAYTKESVDAMRAALAQCAVPVFISPGNHDFYSPGSPWEESWPENVHVFTGDMTSVAVPELDCRIYGAGYRSMDCPGLLRNFRKEGEEKYHICVLHGDPVQLHSPYCPVTAAQVRDSGLDYLALGHIHKAGSFRAAKSVCGWPGAPMGRGFDETREKGAYLVHLDADVSLRFVMLDTPRFYDLEVETEENAAAALEDVLPAVPNDHFYRITLLGSGEGKLKDLQTKFAQFPNLELFDRREAKVDPWETAGTDTLEGTYFRMLREKLDRAGEKEQRVIQLAAELSQKLLQGKEVELL